MEAWFAADADMISLKAWDQAGSLSIYFKILHFFGTAFTLPVSSFNCQKVIELYAFDVAFVSIMKLCGIFFNRCTFKDENIYKFMWLSQFKMSYSGLMGHMLLLTFP